MGFPASNRVVRDAIHGLVSIDAHVRKILDTPPLQRLRWIRQTGLSSLVFPTAEHSRFAHAIGAYAVATRVFDHLRGLARDIDIAYPPKSLQEAAKEFTVAALCHDIGHTAYSHVFENMLLPRDHDNHELFTRKLLHSPRISRCISDYCDFDAVLQIFKGDHGMPVLSGLVAGVVDVDRCDYLLRDSSMCGVSYGTYDLTWFIHTMSLIKDADGLPHLVIDGPRGLDSFRQYIQARRSLYRQVYYHPTIRAAEKLLRAIFERAQEVRDQLDDSQVPAGLRSTIFYGERPSEADFMCTDDSTIMHAVHYFSQGSEDPVLKYLASSFVSRALPKVVYDMAHNPCGGHTSMLDRGWREDMVTRLRDKVRDAFPKSLLGGHDAVDYTVVIDSVPFKAIPLEHVYFHMQGRSYTLAELQSWGSDFDMGELASQFDNVRIYAPEEVKKDAMDFIQGELRV